MNERFDRTKFKIHDSFEAADEADRHYWWSRTPVERMQALERLRQMNYGYGDGKPRPQFQRVYRVVELRRS